MEPKSIMREKAKQFLSEIVELEKKYGLSLSHEDEWGQFIVEPYIGEEEFDDKVKWLLDADIEGCNGT